MGAVLRIALAACALVWNICAAAEVAAPSVRGTAASKQDAAFSRGVLWQVEIKGASPSYLFGTMHWDDDRVLTLPAPVRRAFDRAHRFAPELLTGEVEVRRFRAAMLTREPQLPALLGEEAWRRVDGLLAEHGVPEEARPRFKPWAAMLTLLQPRQPPQVILDYVLVQEAQRSNKPIQPLENIDEQIAVFEEMPQESQMALLRDVADHHEAIQEGVRPIAEAYLRRDLAAIWQRNVDAMSGDALNQPHAQLFLTRVLYARNERMAQRLVPLLREGGVFAAFGALHLYGERGVPSLLQQQGFRVRRLY